MQESSSKSKNKFSFETKELKVPVFESMSRIGTLRIYRIIKWTNFTQKWDFHYFR